MEQRINKWDNILRSLELKEEYVFLSQDERERERRNMRRVSIYSQLLRDEEVFWSQRSKALWIKHGYRCSRLFHRIVNQNHVSNDIRGLLIDRKVCENRDNICKFIVDSYKQLYQEKEIARPFFSGLQLKTPSEDNWGSLKKILQRGKFLKPSKLWWGTRHPDLMDFL